MELPVLYKKTKTKKIQSWAIKRKNNILVVTYGQTDGILSREEKEIKGKNIGKKNETSPQEQAILVAKAMWKKKKDKGYFESITEAKEEEVFLPMLASDFEKHKNKIEYPVYVQPKLDGVRCLARWVGNKVVLMSRGGKEYILPHISKELERYLHKNEVFDGEIYIHNSSFQEITRLVKKYRENETEKLMFWIYDLFLIKELSMPFEQRFLGLGSLDEILTESTDSICVLSTKSVSNEKEVYDFQKEMVKSNFEGAIVRTRENVYSLGHRSLSLLKVKSFKDDEYEIIGFSQATGSQEGTVVWRCKTKDNKEFNVKPKGTIETNKKFFLNGKKYIGSMLKVKYFELTNDGLPRFPVGLGIRMEKDL